MILLLLLVRGHVLKITDLGEVNIESTKGVLRILGEEEEKEINEATEVVTISH